MNAKNSPLLVDLLQCLNSNGLVPSEREVQGIRLNLTYQQRDLLDVEAEINVVHAMLQGLHHRRTELQASISAHQAALAPFRRLPPELYGIVFLHCFKHSTSPGSYDSGSSLDDPVMDLKRWEEEELMRARLGSVCRYWRDILESVPSLWSWFRLTKKNSEAVRTGWLRRSGDTPLTLCLQEAPWSGVPSIYSATLLNPQCSNRIRQMAIHHFSPCAASSLTGSSISLPELQHVHIRSPRGQAAMNVLAEMINSASSLHSLTWEGSFPAGLTWNRLRDITLSDAHIDDVLAVLKQAAETVERCNFTLSSQQPTSFPDSSSITRLMALRHLSLNFTRSTMRSASDDRRPSCLFDYIVAPLLASSHLYSEDFWLSTSFSAFLARSECTLQCLSIGGVVFPRNCLADFLEMHDNGSRVDKSLVVLRVQGGCLLSETVEVLAIPVSAENDETFSNTDTSVATELTVIPRGAAATSESTRQRVTLPRLEELTIDAAELFWATKRLSAMLKSRRHLANPAAQIRIRVRAGGYDKKRSWERHLEDLRAEGFSVVLD